MHFTTISTHSYIVSDISNDLVNLIYFHTTYACVGHAGLHIHIHIYYIVDPLCFIFRSSLSTYFKKAISIPNKK